MHSIIIYYLTIFDRLCRVLYPEIGKILIFLFRSFLGQGLLPDSEHRADLEEDEASDRVFRRERLSAPPEVRGRDQGVERARIRSQLHHRGPGARSSSRRRRPSSQNRDLHARARPQRRPQRIHRF